MQCGHPELTSWLARRLPPGSEGGAREAGGTFGMGDKQAPCQPRYEVTTAAIRPAGIVRVEMVSYSLRLFSYGTLQ